MAAPSGSNDPRFPWLNEGRNIPNVTIPTLPGEQPFTPSVEQQRTVTVPDRQPATPILPPQRFVQRDFPTEDEELFIDRDAQRRAVARNNLRNPRNRVVPDAIPNVSDMFARLRIDPPIQRTETVVRQQLTGRRLTVGPAVTPEIAQLGRTLQPDWDFVDHLQEIPGRTIEPVASEHILGNNERFIVTDRQAHLLTKLWNKITYNPRLARAYPKLHTHPLVQYIINLGIVPDQTILEALQIVVPTSKRRDIRQYLVDNLVEYAEVLSREIFDVLDVDRLSEKSDDYINNYLRQLTDEEIFLILGGKPFYNKRSHLIAVAVWFFRNRSFMLRTSRSYEHSRNRETIMGTDITDKDTIFIAYGSFLQHETYELDDLYGAFYSGDNGELAFRRPEDTNRKFVDVTIEELQKVLRELPITTEVVRLQNRINDVFDYMSDNSVYVTEVRQTVANCTPDQKSLIREFLYRVFYVGMFMRRWGGPGTPYPISSAETTCQIDPQANVEANLLATSDLLDRMSPEARKFCMELHVVNYMPGGLEMGTAPFELLWIQVNQGKWCIRQASTIFVGVAVRYLEIFFNETIPDMEGKKLELIA
jgi:hypothetical protein